MHIIFQFFALKKLKKSYTNINDTAVNKLNEIFYI